MVTPASLTEPGDEPQEDLDDRLHHSGARRKAQATPREDESPHRRVHPPGHRSHPRAPQGPAPRPDVLRREVTLVRGSQQRGRYVRVLITGGAGFLGSHLCELFLERGYEVIAMDNLLTGSADNIGHLFGRKGFSFVHHDVTN